MTFAPRRRTPRFTKTTGPRSIYCGSRSREATAIGAAPVLWLTSEAGVQMDASRRVIWWQDLSGRGGHVTQLIEAFRPEVFDNIFNGFPGIWFDGLDDFLSATGFVAADDFTIFVVAGPSGSLTFPPERTTGTAGRTGQCYVLASDNPAGSDAGACLSLGANGVSVFDYGTAYPGGYMPALAVHFLPDGVSTTCPLTIRYVNRTPSIYLCGALLHTGLTSPKDHVFAPNRVGGGDYGPYSGCIAEIFLYDRALSDPDRQAVEGYLQAKYNCLPLPTPTPPPPTATPRHPLTRHQAIFQVF